MGALNCVFMTKESWRVDQSAEGAGQDLEEAEPCKSGPCANGGQCLGLGAGGYRCYCAGTNFYGDLCQQGQSNLLAYFYLRSFIFRMPEKTWRECTGIR